MNELDSHIFITKNYCVSPLTSTNRPHVDTYFSYCDKSKPINYKNLNETPVHFSNGVERYSIQHAIDIRRDHIYPSCTQSPIAAFQLHDGERQKNNQDVRSYPLRMSPLCVRRAKLQDCIYADLYNADDAAARIATMFPTVSENHIKLLLKKYHNREALVISALQVDKYPITTPGPHSTPPLSRSGQHQSIQSLQTTPSRRTIFPSRENSPLPNKGSITYSICNGSPYVGDRCIIATKPTSSPKLKLRYMKSLFPQVEEITILDVLANNENSIQKSSEFLKQMGHKKKDAKEKVVPPKVEEHPKIVYEEVAQDVNTPKRYTMVEKEQMKNELQTKYESIPMHLIKIALESVSFNKVRASQILDIVVEENIMKEKEKAINVAAPKEKVDIVKEVKNSTLSISESRQSLKSLLKCEKTEVKEKPPPFCRIVEENNCQYKSSFIMNTKGANRQLNRGSNAKNLLEKYVICKGPNPNNKKGPQVAVQGANLNLRSSRAFEIKGANLDNVKSSKRFHSSVYSHIKSIFSRTFNRII